MQSKVSGHWTDDQLIAHVYGIGPEDDHLQECSACQTRLSDMRSYREGMDRIPSKQAEVNVDFLAAQRRQIYAKVAQPTHWWSGTQTRRWASAAATLLVLGGGLMVYEEQHEQDLRNEKVSDAQLAEQVSSMAQDSEPQSTAPLKALFEE